MGATTRKAAQNLNWCKRNSANLILLPKLFLFFTFFLRKVLKISDTRWIPKNWSTWSKFDKVNFMLNYSYESIRTMKYYKVDLSYIGRGLKIGPYDSNFAHRLSFI